MKNTSVFSLSNCFEYFDFLELDSLTGLPNYKSGSRIDELEKSLRKEILGEHDRENAPFTTTDFWEIDVPFFISPKFSMKSVENPLLTLSNSSTTNISPVLQKNESNPEILFEEEGNSHSLAIDAIYALDSTSLTSDNFRLFGTQWPQPNGDGTPVMITYSYSNLLDGRLALGANILQDTVKEALNLWADYAPLTFVEVVDSGPLPSESDSDYSPSNHADIRFGHHFIDGPLNILSHSFFPPPNGLGGLAGDVHFDVSENWSINPAQGIDLLQIAVHEIGHALGLGHESTNTTIMNPFYESRYSGWGTSFLFPDDIEGIRAIYGSGIGSVFDPAQYLASHGDLINAFGYDLEAATQHYIERGFSEGRATDLFDETRYLVSYGDLLNAFGPNLEAATRHYIEDGFNEGRTANLFVPAQYIASYDDLINAFGYDLETATQHYNQFGAVEGRAIDLFDEPRYLASYGDLIDAFGFNLETATQHYIQHGSGEGRVTDLFEPAQYLANYHDLQAAFGNDLFAATHHYIQYGYDEGRIYI